MVYSFVSMRSDFSAVQDLQKPDHVRLEEEVKKQVKNEGTIAVVEVSGTILTRSAKGLSLGSVTYGSNVRSLLNALARNPHVEGVLVRMSTPGGTVTGSDEIYSGIEAVRAAKKKVHVHVLDMSASGGVYSMVAADHVSASPTALLGSIGVIGAQLFRYEHVSEMGSLLSRVRAQKITARTLYVGKGKALGDPFADPDPEALAAFESMLRANYDRFVDIVSTKRNIPKDRIVEFGARIFDTEGARKAGLIDATMSYDEARSHIAMALPCKATCSFVTIKQGGSGGFLGDLLGHFSARSASGPSEHEQVHHLLRQEMVLMMEPFSLR